MTTAAEPLRLTLPLDPDGDRRFAYVTVPGDIRPEESARLLEVLTAWLPT